MNDSTKWYGMNGAQRERQREKKSNWNILSLSVLFSCGCVSLDVLGPLTWFFLSSLLSCVCWSLYVFVYSDQSSTETILCNDWVCRLKNFHFIFVSLRFFLPFNSVSISGARGFAFMHTTNSFWVKCVCMYMCVVCNAYEYQPATTARWLRRQQLCWWRWWWCMYSSFLAI